MNLVLIAALVAVCSAAKLDRTYLPPALAKTAGGSSGSLQTPFVGNSFTQGLGTFPKGSFTNDFQGVVVDAPAAGTRASEGETGLGAPRQYYGSTNSKVGAAAFRGDAGFRQGTTQLSDEEENLDSVVQAANTQASGFPQGFENGPRFEAKPERAQAASDRAANTVRFENEVGTDSYHFAFETDNGISAEENGVATNGVQAQGGYSYTGDDGQVYTVTYTADEGGYQPRGDHLPTPPPIPEEILKSLEQNARDEAAGLLDDGSYDAQKYNAGADYAESDITNVEQNNRQTPNFGRRPESDATASGSFINQNNQAFVRPSPNRISGQEDKTSNIGDSSDDAFGSSNVDNDFAQAPQSNLPQSNRPQSNRPQSDRFGSRNEYRPSNQGFQQTGNTQRPFGSPAINNQQANGDLDSNSQYPTAQAPEESPSLSFGGSNQNTLDTQSSAEGMKPSRYSSSAAAGQFSSSTSNRFGSRNEYLPPVRGQPGRPQRPTSSSNAVPEQSFNQNPETENLQVAGQVQSSPDFEQDFSSASNAVQAPQPFNNFQQKPQGFNNQFSQNSNSFPAENQKATDEKPSSETSFESQRPTSLPSTELTTPLESNESSNESSDREPSPATTLNAQNFNSQPPSQIGSQTNTRKPARPISNGQSQLSNNGFPTRGQNQFSSFPSGNQNPSQESFVQNQPEDAQYSPSTIRPSFNQQQQGADDSYYYRQPAKPFNTPSSSSSRFPSAPPSQFNGISQQSQPQYSGSSQQNFPVNLQPQRGQANRGSTRFPQPPTLASVAPTASINGQFQGSTTSSQFSGITQASASPFRPQNGQASTRYPRPPTLAPTAPTTPLGGFASQYNGITQATASSFISGAPTAATNFNAPTFGPRPTFQAQYQQNQFQSSPAQSFGQRQPQENSNKNQEDQPQSTPNQQYTGEIYDYSKPSEMLPAPAKPVTTASPQRGQPLNQFGQVQENGNAPQPTRPSFGGRPQFGSQRPQFAQNPEPNTQDQPAEDYRPQFNVQQPAGVSRPQLNGQQPAELSMPQYNVQPRPFGGDQSQGPQAFARPQFTQNSGKPNRCCQSLNAQISKLEAQRPAQGNNQGPVRPQFGQSESQFPGSASQGSSQSFAGRGEVFGGPRKPPSFDQETGYHY